jgi:hypothetical protein
MSACLMAQLTCDGDGCGKPMWANDDNIDRLRQEAADLHAWSITDDGDLCSTCVAERLARDLRGHEGAIADAVREGGYEPWWPL